MEPSRSVKSIPRLSTFSFLLLQAVTFGIYAIVWLAERRDRINDLLKFEVISSKSLKILSILLGVSLFGDMIDLAGSAAGGEVEVVLGFASSALNLPFWIYMIILTFRLIPPLQAYFNEKYGFKRINYNKFIAFFLCFTYLNYKINEAQDLESYQEANPQQPGFKTANFWGR